MSRQPSPGPSGPAQHTSYYRDAHGLPIEKGQAKISYRGGDQPPASSHHQGASAPPLATSSSSGRTKSRGYQSGIAAGAEDVKYAAKYRDLKQKVKEIEADNDKLLFKVLQAKRNIQRAKLERAILYERLAELPASPPQAHAALPTQHAPQQVPPGGQAPRHSDVRPYGQSERREHVPGPPALHHRHSQHHQPIQPAPPAHVSPPQHHLQAHHPVQDAAHPGPNGRPVTTADGRFIPAQDIHAPPPPSASHHRKRGGRVNKEVREREARELHEREEIDRKREQTMMAGTSSAHSAPMHGIPSESASQAPQIAPVSSRERERDWEMEREMRERERMQRREARDDERAHGHGHSHHRTHGHGHHYHQHATERGRSPPPPGNSSGPSPIQTSPPQVHRSYSNHSHSSYGHGHHVHSHHSHSHSHSGSPRSPGGTAYPHTRIHGHQRVGPGSYVIRDRERADALAAEQAQAQSAPATAATQNEEAPPPVSSVSRVPTPPYIQRPSRSNEDTTAGTKSEVSQHTEEAQNARGPSSTPS